MLLAFCADPKALFYMSREELDILFENRLFTAKNVKIFCESRNIESILSYERRLKALGIKYVTIEDIDYPEQLMSLYDPPYILYYFGTLPTQRLSIGVVGSRKCTAYGRKVAEQFGEALGRADVNVVSGLARGIDTYSHTGALKANGFTTAVLGAGINVCYPKENLKLMKEIAQRGCVISEYGLDVEPRAGNFPRRNRIISGLSNGLLLVEARKKSGSLITVDCALESGKDVFAIPGDVLGGSNQGSNNVIRMGAKPVFSVEDILEEFKGSYWHEKLDGLESSGVIDPLGLYNLEEDEKAILVTLGAVPVHIEEIEKVVRLDVPSLQFALTKLELKDLILQLPGKHFIRNK